MDKISRGFVGRTVRAVVFIILIIVFCTAISSAGIYLASRFGLTQSREQVPLTALYLGNEGKVELPGRGKMVEGNGWRLRNSRDSYTLTLDNAVIENAAEKNAVEKDTSEENTVMENTESPRPGIDITGDLIIELKEGSGSWLRSEGAGIRIQSGTLVIRGKGNLDIEAGTAGILGDGNGAGQPALRLEGGQLDVKGMYAGISCPEVELAGSSGRISAAYQSGIGLCSCRLKVEESKGEMRAAGGGAAVLAYGRGEFKPSIKADGKMAVEPDDVRIVEFNAPQSDDIRGCVEKNGGWMKENPSSLLTYSAEDMVTYNEDTSCFDGSARTLRFAAE